MRCHRSRSLPGLRVTRVLDRLQATIGPPQTIVVENGSEFAGRTLDAWAHAHGVSLRFIRPGKPIESVCRKLQRQLSQRTPERALVSESGRCEGCDREAHRLQHRAPAQPTERGHARQYARITERARRVPPVRPDKEDEPYYREVLTIRVADFGGTSPAMPLAMLDRTSFGPGHTDALPFSSPYSMIAPACGC